jgi:hypothetical protein
VRRRVEALEVAARCEEVAARLRADAERHARWDGCEALDPRELGRAERLEAGLPTLIRSRELPERPSGVPEGWYVLHPDGSLAELASWYVLRARRHAALGVSRLGDVCRERLTRGQRACG